MAPYLDRLTAPLVVLELELLELEVQPARQRPAPELRRLRHPSPCLAHRTTPSLRCSRESGGTLPALLRANARLLGQLPRTVLDHVHLHVLRRQTTVVRRREGEYASDTRKLLRRLDGVAELGGIGVTVACSSARSSAR